MTNASLSVGPALECVIDAQRADDDAVSYPRLQDYGNQLASLCEQLHGPVVWPVGSAAERLAGAAVIVSEGQVKTRGWNTDVSGLPVLLVTVTALTPLALYAAAQHARNRGANKVFACGVRVEGLPPGASPILDYFPLTRMQMDSC